MQGRVVSEYAARRALSTQHAARRERTPVGQCHCCGVAEARHHVQGHQDRPAAHASACSAVRGQHHVRRRERVTALLRLALQAHKLSTSSQTLSALHCITPAAMKSTTAAEHSTSTDSGLTGNSGAAASCIMLLAFHCIRRWPRPRSLARPDSWLRCVRACAACRGSWSRRGGNPALQSEHEGTSNATNECTPHLT
jgi:hypothetical protein